MLSPIPNDGIFVNEIINCSYSDRKILMSTYFEHHCLLHLFSSAYSWDFGTSFQNTRHSYRIECILDSYYVQYAQSVEFLWSFNSSPLISPLKVVFENCR